MKLADPVTVLPKIGPKTKQILAKLNIFKVEDLVLHAPSRYENPKPNQTIADIFLSSESKASLTGVITKLDNIYTRNGKKITKAVISDSTGKAEAIWFNRHYLANTILVNSMISIFGKVDKDKNRLKFISPEFEMCDKSHELINTAGIVPVYPLTDGLTAKWLRQKIKYVLDNIEISEILPEELRNSLCFADREVSIRNLHFPTDFDSAKNAKRRLSFEEFLLIHLKGLYLRSLWNQKNNSHVISIHNDILDKFLKTLPFSLTTSQQKVVNEILGDLKKESPMNRLLQGDVGSGKTIVALIAALASVKSGFNVIYLAPTQILAKQHFNTFSKYLNKYKVDVLLRVAGNKNYRTKKDDINNIGKPYIVIGTHAILHTLKDYDNIGLIIIDEQHKFGVAQRTDIIRYYSKDLTPNLLTMTATPIPRSIALTLYGDLDLSIIDSPPKNRKQTITWLISESKRPSSFEWIKNMLRTENLQVIFVCPFIEESEKEDLRHVKAVEKMFIDISSEFIDFRVHMLHGKQKSEDKNKIINDFSNHLIDILVTTPVIEVGVDIPNANIIFIETAERFGLASLHQLRGRVGRGEKQGYCILMPSTKENSSLSRLKYMEHIYSGQKLAEIDFKLRGPGNIYGVEQHGIIDLKLGNFNDIELVKQAKAAATDILEHRIRSTPFIENFLENIYKIARN